MVPLEQLTFEKIKFNQYNTYRMHSVALPQQNITFLVFEALLGANWQDQAVPTFEINGHGASVL